MDRRSFLKKGALSLAALAGSSCRPPLREKRPAAGFSPPPHIVVILADDMGYGDPHAFNPESRIPTPNLDRLAKAGMRFTDAHSGSAVCTPTRYGLMTGRYCWRTELKRGVLVPPNDKPLIGPERLTVAGMLGRRGYHSACIGKWHLGMDWGRTPAGEVDFNRPIRYGPTDVGFDEFFGVAASLDMIPYVFYRGREPIEPVDRTQPRLPFPRYMREGPRGENFDPGRALDRLTREAVDFIERRAGESSPFFLYFALTAPHKPVWPEARFEGRTELGPYGDFVHQVDWSVGEVLDALKRTGIADDTLVVFTSDNGSYMYRLSGDRPDHSADPSIQGYAPGHHQANAGWRGTKADIWEAGHRVPFLVRWPGRVPPGSTCGETVCLTDIMATGAEITGFSLPERAAEDSFSLLPLMTGGRRPAPRAPVIHHSINGTFSIRDGRWKMVFGSGSGGRQKPVGKPFEKPYFLFDLENDPAETVNLIDSRPDVARRLTEELEKIRQGPGSRPGA